MKRLAYVLWSVGGFCVMMTALMLLVEAKHLTMDQGNWVAKGAISLWIGFSVKAAWNWFWRRRKPVE